MYKKNGLVIYLLNWIAVIIIIINLFSVGNIREGPNVFSILA